LIPVVTRRVLFDEVEAGRKLVLVRLQVCDLLVSSGVLLLQICDRVPGIGVLGFQGMNPLLLGRQDVLAVRRLGWGLVGLAVVSAAVGGGVAGLGGSCASSRRVWLLLSAGYAASG
jgi:hypothetical protein